MNNRFVIKNKDELQGCLSLLQMADIPDGGALYIQVSQKDDFFSAEQRRLMWTELSYVAKHCRDEDGKGHSKEWWHHRLKIDFGYIAGVMAVRFEGSMVDIPVPKSASDTAKGAFRMSKDELSDYITQLQQYGAEHGDQNRGHQKNRSG